MAEITVLEILWAENRYRFRLKPPNAGETIHEYIGPPVPKARQEQLRQAIERITQGADEPDALVDLGQMIYSFLLPREIQEYLRKTKTPLILSTDTPELPWELCYDDESQQFLGLKCPIARQLTAEITPAPENILPESPSFLLIGNPQGDMTGAEHEIQQVAEIVSQQGGYSQILNGSRAILAEVQLKLQSAENFIGLHYTGRVGFDESSGEQVLLLANRTKMAAGMVPKLLRNHPFVFLNVCSATRSGLPGRRLAPVWSISEALALAFSHSGAPAIIAIRGEVGEQGAVELAVLFYKLALQGFSVGEALRQAKLRGQEQRPDDTAWAAFILYGNPNFCLVNPMGLFLAGGQLNRTHFDPAAQSALDHLPREVQRSGYTFIGAPHFFISLTQIEGGCTQQALRQLGYSPGQVGDQLRHDINQRRSISTSPTLAKSSFSEHARRILEAANEEARTEAVPLITERHLLLGFLRVAEEATVKSLQRQGIDLARLRAILRGEEGEQEVGSVTIVSPPAQPVSSAKPPPRLPLTDDARQVFSFALQEAHRLGYNLIETPHLVIGLTKIRNGCTAQALQQQGFDPKRVRDVIRYALKPMGSPRPNRAEFSYESLSPRVEDIVQLAEESARSVGTEAIDECHLLVGFLKVQGSSTAEFLKGLEINLEEMLISVQARQQGVPLPSPTPLLNKLGRDLTREAREGKLKPIIGRRQEMSRIAQILARTDKNTPLLIGDAGVGKTAIVEGLAQRIADDKVPPHLRGKRIIELPIAGLVAGTKYRGELEERLAQVIREASQADIILFLDEIHTLVGAGRAEGGALDAGNIFKPTLARGDIRCIGATTLNEFRQSIEKDAALERRFQRIMIEEPSPEETLEMLRQTRSRYEKHHRVHLLDEALEAAVKLSIAYLPERRLPDKACDLVEEACVRTWVGSASQWSVQAPVQPTEPPIIEAEAVARVVAEWTGIPVARLTEAEQSRLLKLEELLRQQVVGQEEAITAVAQAVRLGRAGLKKPNRPVGVFLFIGPTGVGKTELAKTLAEILFGSEQELVRLDMSEYMEAHSVARLIGAPPGYVGYEEEGQLTGALRRKPYSVVLLDEIEKAHPRIFDLFLQLFDDGRLTDAQGRLADGKNALFIMTSNVATELIEKRQPLGFHTRIATTEDLKPKVIAELRQVFRPEFLNRLDEIILFHHLSAEHIRAIARLQLDRLVAELQTQHGLTLVIEENALDFICDQGYSEKYGARLLERTIERWIAKPLSEFILAGVRDTIRVKAEAGTISLARDEEYWGPTL